MKKANTVDEYLAAHAEHGAALDKLRAILIATELDECIKWGAPCYTLAGKNVIGLAAFKTYVGLWFHQGVFLDDPDGVLVNAQEGKTKALRQWRFSSARDIKVRQVRAYVRDAIAKMQLGKTMAPSRKTGGEEPPPELARALEQDKPARDAFGALTPGKRREYCDYVSEAKRAETKERRVTKILPMISAGAGLHDKYRGC